VNYLETVRKAAGTLNLLDPATGTLVPMDSLSVLDLVNELETATHVSIPTNELRAEAFASLETVAELLQKLTRAR
jgi:acyl carrier protein